MAAIINLLVLAFAWSNDYDPSTYPKFCNQDLDNFKKENIVAFDNFIGLNPYYCFSAIDHDLEKVTSLSSNPYQNYSAFQAEGSEHLIACSCFEKQNKNSLLEDMVPTRDEYRNFQNKAVAKKIANEFSELSVDISNASIFSPSTLLKNGDLCNIDSIIKKATSCKVNAGVISSLSELTHGTSQGNSIYNLRDSLQMLFLKQRAAQINSENKCQNSSRFGVRALDWNPTA